MAAREGGYQPPSTYKTAFAGYPGAVGNARRCHAATVATLAVDTWVHFQRRRPGQVVQNRGVDEAVLQRYELSGRRQGNRLPNLSGRHAPLGQRLQEIPFVCCFPGNEVAGTG